MSLFERIGAVKEVDIDTSETSSYHSSDGENKPAQPAQPFEESKDPCVDGAGAKKAKKQKKGGDTMMVDEDAGEDNEMSSYSKFKTQNETDIDKAFQSGP